ncbi:DUF1648 domain-containing protein [Streptomyces sp. NRRL F-2580]|uniref:DUF1648 domain-containing protein n=1 Tax=Streptomyces sp. NRRL F-2580 TaxID=1463841 RepID=UPI001F19E7A0|nr:DUF1648 domain-containing protein [Streptomyces sp. NRRL F-2580]
MGLPLTASARLPDRMATHWGGGGGGGGGASAAPDGSTSFGESLALPTAIWAVLALGVAVFTVARARAATVLLPSGVLLAGAQAAIVRANLDHEDWRQADPPDGRVVAAVLAAAVLAAVAGALINRQGPVTAVSPAAGAPVMDIPAGERLVWLARTSNPWLRLTAAGLGAVAAVAAVAGAGGLLGPAWQLVAPFGVASVSALAFSSVRARVTGQGLEVGFGPLGWPVRRWAAADIESARAEDRTPTQVGGWGYRLSGLGTTVMLRAGECLVVRSRGKDFAVSVDDAARGAALLNSLVTGTRSTPQALS